MAAPAFTGAGASEGDDSLAGSKSCTVGSSSSRPNGMADLLAVFNVEMPIVQFILEMIGSALL
jgi:hypothetical protein